MNFWLIDDEHNKIMDYGYGYDVDAYIPLTVFEHFDWNADQSGAIVPQYIIDGRNRFCYFEQEVFRFNKIIRFSDTREPNPTYDNEINYAFDEVEVPEMFTKIPGSTLGIDAMVTVSKDNFE